MGAQRELDQSKMSGQAVAAARDCTYEKSGTGTVGYDCCPCCGRTEWGWSNQEPKDKLVIVVRTQDYITHCSRCAYVQQRHPELFEWVVGVAQQQIANSESNP